MLNLSELSSRAVAAVCSVTISTALFAYAIVPAEQGIAVAGMVA